MCGKAQTVKGGAHICVQVVCHLERAYNRQRECVVLMRCRARQAELATQAKPHRQSEASRAIVGPSTKVLADFVSFWARAALLSSFCVITFEPSGRGCGLGVP